MKTLFWYAPKEIECQTHGRMQETVPWVPTYSRITYRLVWRLCTLCQVMTQKAVAGIQQMESSTLSDLLHKIITRVRHTHKINVLVTLALCQVDIIGFRVTVVFRKNGQHAGNGHSPCQVLQRGGGTPQ